MSAISLASFAVLLAAGNRQARVNGDIHLVIKTVRLTGAALTKFDHALPADKSRFFIKYDPPPAGHLPHDGNLPNLCPQTGTHLNTYVTQQVSFRSTEDLKTFLDNAF